MFMPAWTGTARMDATHGMMVLGRMRHRPTSMNANTQMSLMEPVPLPPNDWPIWVCGATLRQTSRTMQPAMISPPATVMTLAMTLEPLLVMELTAVTLVLMSLTMLVGAAAITSPARAYGNMRGLLSFLRTPAVLPGRLCA